jgi:hypothetical protein
LTRRTFEPPEPPPGERRARREIHLLALSGGGYRGLFTACVLAGLERDGPALASRFDYLAGTSIGGILAIGLACGKSAEELRATMLKHGPAIFSARALTARGLARTQYRADGLRKAIIAILGEELAHSPFAALPARLVVCAVDEHSSHPMLFRTGAFGLKEASDLPILDVALATSAAPTFFPPHLVKGDGSVPEKMFVDGGLVANAPDLLLVTEAWRHRLAAPDATHMLSIGTAGSARTGRIASKSLLSRVAGSGGIGWLARHKLIELIMTAQEEMAVAQAQSLGLATYLRIDAAPEQPIDLDDTSARATGALAALAEEALREARTRHPEDLRRFGASRSEQG